MTSQTHREYNAAHIAKLPEHLQHLAEGIIIDWLIRTGQWDPAAQAKIAASKQDAQEHPLPTARTNEKHS